MSTLNVKKDSALIRQKRWLKEFDAIPIDGEIKKKILKDNAERLIK